MESERNSMSTAEHILLEGDEFDEDFDVAQSRTPQQHFHIVNRSHALQTEMILFEGGWLSLRHHRRNKPGEAQLINLRYLDPRPAVSRYFAKRTLGLSAGLFLAGLLVAALAYLSVLIVITIPATILLLTASAVAFAACAYRTRKRVVFVTRHGRAPVIELMATLGEFSHPAQGRAADCRRNREGGRIAARRPEESAQRDAGTLPTARSRSPESGHLRRQHAAYPATFQIAAAESAIITGRFRR